MCNVCAKDLNGVDVKDLYRVCVFKSSSSVDLNKVRVLDLLGFCA